MIKIKIKKTFEVLHFSTSLFILFLILIPSVIAQVPLALVILRSGPLTCIAMAGFAYNNYIDAEKDRLNKPKRAIPSGVLTKRQVAYMSACLYCIAFVLMLANLNDHFLLVINFSGFFGTLLYSRFFKELAYIKTLITSLLTILPYIIVLHYYNIPVNNLVFILAIILLSVGKELLMDVRDVKGDAEVGQQTLAVKFGARNVEKFSFAISILSVFLLASAYKLSFAQISIIMACSLIVISTSYAMWFSRKKRLQDTGIYLLWGSIIICTLPILV